MGTVLSTALDFPNGLCCSPHAGIQGHGPHNWWWWWRRRRRRPRRRRWWWWWWWWWRRWWCRWWRPWKRAACAAALRGYLPPPSPPPQVSCLCAPLPPSPLLPAFPSLPLLPTLNPYFCAPPAPPSHFGAQQWLSVLYHYGEPIVVGQVVLVALLR